MTATTTTTAECPECGAEWQVSGLTKGEIIQCPECGVELEVVEVVPNEKIVLKWEANEGEPPNLSDSDGTVRQANYQTTVTMTFTPLDDDTRTLVEIREEGWRETQAGLEASYGNCQGWSQMLCAMKVWIEHGFNMREGMYK